MINDIFLNNYKNGSERFSSLLERSFKEYEKSIPKLNVPHIIWDEFFFNLDKSYIYNNLIEEHKKNILTQLTYNILQEAYFIECAGMAYAAKMSLTSNSIEEKQFFCIMAKEEATHLRYIVKLLKSNIPLSLNKQSFAFLIGKIIDEVSRKDHLLLIQILLEGWGIYYYRSLYNSTNCLLTREIFNKILNDESRHHAVGVILYNQDNNEYHNSNTIYYLKQIIDAIKSPPIDILNEINKYNKNFFCDIKNVEIFLREIEAINSVKNKLNLIKELLCKNIDNKMFNSMIDMGLFAIPSVEEMTLNALKNVNILNKQVKLEDYSVNSTI